MCDDVERMIKVDQHRCGRTEAEGWEGGSGGGVGREGVSTRRITAGHWRCDCVRKVGGE